MAARTGSKRPAQIIKPTPTGVAKAAEALLRGELVGMPTETVYGLAGLALDARAVARIFEAKERPTFDPLIVHAASARGAFDVVDWGSLNPEARERAERLANAFWPGPMTLVLPKQQRVPDLVTSGLGSVAVRVPRHPVALALLKAVGAPLAAPSANRFGRISPTSAADVREELGDRIGLILDGGRCEIGVESTVISIDTGGRMTLLRPGGLPRSELERVARVPVESVVASTATKHLASRGLLSPGMSSSHYAPRTPLRLLAKAVSKMKSDDLAEVYKQLRDAKSMGLLVASGDAQRAARVFAKLIGRPVVAAQSLTKSGRVDEAANNLFSSLRKLDASGAELLLAEPCPAEWDIEKGLGHAIADRLRRASVREARPNFRKPEK